jgi:hypothetical protein
MDAVPVHKRLTPYSSLHVIFIVYCRDPAPAPGVNFDAAPAQVAPAPTLRV